MNKSIFDKFDSIEERINWMLEQMGKAMPEVRRQVKVYEDSIKNKKTMAKIDKKKAKLQERIEFLEDEMRTALGKKTSDTKEINIPNQLSKINELKLQLKNLK